MSWSSRTRSRRVRLARYRQTGLWIAEYVEENRATLRRLAAWLTASCVFLSIEVVLFGVSFMG